MNASNRRKVEADLETAIRQKRGNWTAYLVIVIPKQPMRYKREIQKGVFETDGASFYGLATGHENAMHDLFHVLCSEFDISKKIAEYCQGIVETSIPPRI